MSNSRVLIVEARFYPDIADELVSGAMAKLDKESISYEVISVPGAFEIPAAISLAARTGTYDGYIALGCVIRGETSHYDYVCGESARALMDLSVREHLPIGYGILTVENKEQADVRAAVSGKNKGADAAEACVSVMALKRKFAPSRTEA